MFVLYGPLPAGGRSALLTPQGPMEVGSRFRDACRGQDPHDQLTVPNGVNGAVVADSEPPAGALPLKGLDVERCGVANVQCFLEFGEAVQDTKGIRARDLENVPLSVRREPRDVPHEFSPAGPAAGRPSLRARPPPPSPRTRLRRPTD